MDPFTDKLMEELNIKPKTVEVVEEVSPEEALTPEERRARMEQRHDLINKAIHFAAEKHLYQCRKGGESPYILHPMEAMQIVQDMGGTHEEMVAAMLHDTVEDTNTTIEEIEKEFGKEVAKLVAICTEDKEKNWEARKQQTLDTLEISDLSVKRVMLGDKLSNLRCIARDYEQLGEDLWQRFTGTPAQQAWYYGGLTDLLADLTENSRSARAYWEFLALYKDVFVTFFYTPEPEAFYQVNRNGEAYVLYREDPQWVPVGEDRPAYADPVSRWQVEMTEEMWMVEFWDNLQFLQAEEGPLLN